MAQQRTSTGLFTARAAVCARTHSEHALASDITRRAQWARDHNDGKPKPAWSTGERLAVALMLGDQATLDAEDYTRQEAEQRLAGDLAFYGYTAHAGTWLAEIRAGIGLPRITEG